MAVSRRWSSSAAPSMKPNLRKRRDQPDRDAREGPGTRKLAGQGRLAPCLPRSLRVLARNLAQTAQHRPGDRRGDFPLLLLRRTEDVHVFGVEKSNLDTDEPQVQGQGPSRSSRPHWSFKNLWVLAVMRALSNAIGVVSGMREGSRTNRSESVISIATTSTLGYLSGVVLHRPLRRLARLAQRLGAASAMSQKFYNFAFPVATVAIYGMGYVGSITRAPMIEVMNAQDMRTAHSRVWICCGGPWTQALRNALIAPFTGHVFLFPWLFNRRGDCGGDVSLSGLRSGPGGRHRHSDIDLLLVSISFSVTLVLLTRHLISDIGYAWLNPRVRRAVSGVRVQFLSPARSFSRPSCSAHVGEPRACSWLEPRLPPPGLWLCRHERDQNSPGLLLVGFWMLAGGCARRIRALAIERLRSLIGAPPPGAIKPALPACPYLFGGDKLARSAISGASSPAPDRAHNRTLATMLRARGRRRAGFRRLRAAASTPRSRSWPIWCWPSLSSSCSTSWCRRILDTPIPMRWRRSSSPFDRAVQRVLRRRLSREAARWRWGWRSPCLPEDGCLRLSSGRRPVGIDPGWSPSTLDVLVAVALASDPASSGWCAA